MLLYFFCLCAHDLHASRSSRTLWKHAIEQIYEFPLWYWKMWFQMLQSNNNKQVFPEMAFLWLYNKNALKYSHNGQDETGRKYITWILIFMLSMKEHTHKWGIHTSTTIHHYKGSDITNPSNMIWMGNWQLQFNWWILSGVYWYEVSMEKERNLHRSQGFFLSVKLFLPLFDIVYLI